MQESPEKHNLELILRKLKRTVKVFESNSYLLPKPDQLKRDNKILSDKYANTQMSEFDRQTTEQLQRKWQEIKSIGIFQEFSRREVIILCSITNIVKEEPFLKLLENWESSFPLRGLQYLLASIHECWGENPHQEELCYAFRKILKGYAGNRPYLQAWSKNSKMYLSEEGVKEFAWLLTTENYDLPTLCQKYFLPSSSSRFVELIRVKAVNNAIEELRRSGEYNPAFWQYLFNSLIRKTDFEQLSNLIKIVNSYGNSDAEEFLKQWFLNPDYFGDPRIDTGYWNPIDETAKNIFIKWLSKEDLEFFFNLLLRKGEDEHGRREFWQQYLGHVVSSRVLISDEDLARNREVIREMRQENKTLPGRIKENTSAFIMQTKNLVIIEFSEKGNACYIFNKSDLPRALEYDLNHLYERNKVFARGRLIKTSIPQLTKDYLGINDPSVRFSHSPPSGWQAKPKRWLELQGIRPKRD